MQIREAFSHLETNGHVFVLVKLLRYLYLGGKTVEGFACLNLQSAVNGEVGNIKEQTAGTFWFPERQQFVLDGGGIGHPRHEIVAAGI